MRKQFVLSVEKTLAENPKTVLMLGDISVFAFRNSFKKYPNRVYNIGILEQSMISLSAGLASLGFIPIVHTIAPFLVERAYEQLKIDFGYQELAGKFITIGASYDYPALGPTHECPADINLLSNIPNMQIIVPGTAKEFAQLFQQTYNNNKSTYYRLSDYKNTIEQKVQFKKANIVKKGKKATVIVVGPLLDKVIEATKNLSVTILYYTTVLPFDSKTLIENNNQNKILICQPFYSGILTTLVASAFNNQKIMINEISIPKKFSNHYGTGKDQEINAGFTETNIRSKVKKIINE